jgi:ABC-type branched-subunit amino acid transport system substrate-binding protein
MYPVGAYGPSSLPAAAASYFSSQHADKANVLALNTPNALVTASTAQTDFVQAGIQVPLSLTFPATAVDFTAEVARAKDSGASNVFLIANGNAQLVPFFQTAIQQGYRAKIFITGYSATWPSQLGADANGLVVAAPSGPLLGAGQAGENATSIVHRYYPSIDTLSVVAESQSWTAAEAIVEAVKELHGAPANSASLIQALNGLKDWKSTFSPPLTYTSGANSDPTRCTQLLEVQGGNWSPVAGQRFTCWTQSTAPPTS